MKAIAAFASLTSAFFISITSLTLGWGLHPVSWGWIIGCFAAMVVVSILTTALAADK